MHYVFYIPTFFGPERERETETEDRKGKGPEISVLSQVLNNL